MKPQGNIKPTETELEILQILWELGQASVKDVNTELNKKKETGYTTTLKMMQIMFEKGLLQREKEGRGHIYRASHRQEDTQMALLDKVLDSAFGGSAGKLIMQTLGNKKTTQEELDEIKEMIEKIEKEDNEHNK